MNKPIDFVITWVDGNDPKWLEKKKKYNNESSSKESNKIYRYRDWGLLKYWFRCVDKFAPWVNRIFLITDHQIPEWINLNNEKLVLINHEDYIPSDYLPTFNSNVIELFINRIEGLSDNFVYFNDDMFITDYVDEKYFFINDTPRDSFVYNAVSVFKENSIIEHSILNNLELLSNEFSKKEVDKKNFIKIYNLLYGKHLIRNVLLKGWKGFTGIYNPHTAISYNKKSFDYLWNKYSDEFYKTASHKYRDKNDINHWIVRYYQLLSGYFIPRKLNKQKYYSLTNDNSAFLTNVYKRKYKMICINDNDDSINYDFVKKQLLEYFEKIVNEKSGFEK